MLVVEDGTGLATANSYVSVAEADEYHMARRSESWLSQDVEEDHKVAALIRATGYLDALYRGRYSGQPRRRREQRLAWPRVNAAVGCDAITETEVPRELREAVCQAALREVRKPGSLLPDLKQGGAVRSISAGPTSVQFAGGGYTGAQVFQEVDLLIAPLLTQAAAFSGRLERT